MNLDKLNEWLIKNNCDVAYISDPLSINYFTGFNMDPNERIFALVAFKDKPAFIFAPELNVEEAKHSAWNGDVYGYLDEQNPWQKIANLVSERIGRPQKIAIEKSFVSIARLEALKSVFTDADFSTDVSKLIGELRIIKTEEEVKQLQAAGAEADYAFEVGFNALRNGVTERYVAGQIEYRLKLDKGVMHTSFETICQAGTNAANPHLGPTLNTIKPNQLVLFDLGTMHNGYASDSSRTVAYGEPSAKEKEIYEIDREAQQAAIDAARPGMTAGELDAVARDIITQAGYGEYFIHRLGHGIGMSVHELPQIMSGNDFILQEGMCFSIEPGIYIPNVGGVRIEDCGVLTNEGFKTFTKTDKQLKYIPVKE